MILSSYTAASRFVGYCGEVVANRNEIVATVRDRAIEEQAASYMMDYSRSSTAAATLLCRQVFDIAHAGHDASNEDRQEVGRIGGLMLILTDIVDGQIDRPTMPLEAKEEYLDQGIRTLLSGVTPDLVPENKDQKVSFMLAHHLYEKVLRMDEEGGFAALFRELVPNIKRQLRSDDMQEHLKLASSIGAVCAELGAVTTEYVTGTHQPEARMAAAGIGAYAQCLDHAYEMREDVRSGVYTYATLYLKQHGDTPVNRKQAREDLLDAGSDASQEGLAVLDDTQRAIYKAMRRMLDVRYRLYKRMSSMGGIVYV